MDGRAHLGDAWTVPEGVTVGKEPPPCGHCTGTGRVTYERPRQQEDGSVTWVESVEHCHVCGGSGLCR